MSTTKRVLGGVLATLVGTASALFIGMAPAYADAGPHQSRAITTDTTVTGEGPHVAVDSTLGISRCASCHRAHTAKGAYLLTAADQETMCFTCHGAGALGTNTDVESGIDPNSGLALRGGGFKTAMIGASEAKKDIYFNATRQSYSSTNQMIPVAGAENVTSTHLAGGLTLWGNGAWNTGAGKSLTTKLECGSCHDPHGNGQYRILKPVPSDSGFATITTNTATGLPNAQPGVFIKDTANKVYTTTNYWTGADPAALADTATNKYLGATSITNPTPIVKTLSASAGQVDSYISNVAAWCTTCHTRYLAPSGSWGTTSGDAIFTYRHTGEQISGEMGASRNCIQCHVAHGSNAQMSLRSAVEWPGGTTKTQDSRLLRVDDRGICLMCHNV